MFKLRFLKKFTSWEYWPAYMFYIPNLAYALYLAVRAKNFTFYSIVNPGIKSSGNGTESKFKTLQLVPEEYRPLSVYVPEHSDFESIIRKLHKQGIDYPLIAKPDVGFRGLLVEKIYSDDELKTYLKTYPIPIILQEYIEFPNECGLFYHRVPGNEKGNITSLTLKSFLTVVGDGFSTLAELIRYDKRAQYYEKLIQKTHRNSWNTIPKKGEMVVISDIGNHSRGAQFINGNHFINSALESSFDKLNKQIEGWYYGRLDIKYNTMKELQKGENYKILEINGILAEPTHIYDAYHSTYFSSLEAIREHWKYAFHIAMANHKRKIPYKKFGVFWKEIQELMTYIKKIKKIV